MVASVQQRAAQLYLRRTYASMDLMEFVPAVSPDYEAPRHLQPLVDLVSEAFGAGIRAATSVPPQHAKSETLFHLFILHLLRDPTKRHLYGTYSIDFAHEQSIKALEIARRAHLPLTRTTMGDWRTPEGGGILWTGRGGRLTGSPVDGIAVVDDPLKNWEEADSPTTRRRAINFVREVIQRLHPGASLILNATRWHMNDPTGYFVREHGWPHVNMPALDEDGNALWPSQRPYWYLMKQKADVDQHDWDALYMGNPHARESALIPRVPKYERLPPRHVPYTEAVGFDGAYTESARADWTVAIKGRLYQGVEPGDPERLYVTDCIRVRAEAGDVPKLLRDAGMTRVTWRRSGTEKGMVAFLRREGIDVNEVVATGDKLAAARPVINDLRKSLVMFPESATWLHQVESELLSFTGSTADQHDDVIDALGALHHEVMLYSGPDVEAVRKASGL